MINLNNITRSDLEKLFVETNEKIMDWYSLKTFIPNMDTVVLLSGSHGYSLGRLTKDGWHIDGCVWWQPTFESIFTHYAYIRGPDVPSTS